MRKRVTRLCLILIVILGSSVVRGEDLCVPSQYPSIQSAIDDAENGDVVIVDPNTYYENINFSGKAITVRSADPNNPNIVSVTIIDGSLPADPNYASVVTFNSGEGNDSVLEGFTITGGTGSWIPVSWEFQGLLWNRCGGGVVCYNMSQPTISKNVFIGNMAGQGGGVYIYGAPVNPDDPSNPPVHISPIIIGNVFEDNSAIVEHGFTPPDSSYPQDDHGDGGAIVAFQGCDPIVTDNLMQNNHADYYGGAIHFRQWSNGLIENNHIISNDSALGAGVHITYMSEPTVRDNLIQANIAGNFGGGGVYVYYLSNPLIERNFITENESSNGAGIGIFHSSNPTIRNNLIINNVEGAGIRVKGGSTPTIIGNTIAGNEGSAAYGGGIECITDSAPVIENNIIVSDASYGIYASVVPPVVKYNNVWDHSAGNYCPLIGEQTGINGNISADPQFAGVQDYHLQLSSACINAGDPNYLPEPGETDYYGEQRLLGQCVDIGANEAWPVWNITSGSRYDNIQQAINDANDGDVVVLARGRYTGQGNRDIDFGGKPVTLRSTDPEDFDIVAATIIDSQGATGNAHRGFYFHSGEDANSVVSGLTITGGGGAYQGGGINCIFNSSPTITNCIITNNLTIDHGGGIHCGYGSSPTITNCIISSNSFNTYGYGGGIYCRRGSSPTITNCIITNNSAIGNSPPGHGHHGGGICCWGDSEDTPSNPIITNCIISGNSAEHRGGGLYAYWSSPIAVNCTIVGNTAYEGGGIGSFREANPTAVNCIVRDNTAVFGNQLALINTLRLWPWEEITEMTISYSNIEGGLGDVCVDDNMVINWGQGNIDAEPNFVDPGYWDDAGTSTDPNDDFFVVGNYHLLPVSPCIDAGDNASVPLVSIVDIDDEPRIFNDTVDMGADEFVTNPADFNIDGIVGFNDLVVLAVEWLDSGAELQSDLVDDDFVDLADYTTFAEQWLHLAAWYE